MALWIHLHPPVGSWLHFQRFSDVYLFPNLLEESRHHKYKNTHTHISGLTPDPVPHHHPAVICCCSDPTPNIMMPQDTHCPAAASRQAGHDAELMTLWYGEWFLLGHFIF